MLSNLRIIGTVLIFICITSCQRKNKKPTVHAEQVLTIFLHNAQDNTFNFKERLGFALKVDSMAILQNDTQAQLESLKLIANLYLDQDSIQLAKTYLLKSIEFAKSVSNQEELAIATNSLGAIFTAHSQYDSALEFYNNAISIFRKAHHQLYLAQTLANTGVVLKNDGDLQGAFKVTLDAIKIFEPLRDTLDLGAAYTTLGNILKELHRFDEALQYHRMALQLLKVEHDSAGMALALNNIGNVFRYKKEYAGALSNYFQALEINGKHEHIKTLATITDNIANTYLELKNYNSAETYFKRAIGLRIESGDKDGFLTTSNRLSRLYLEQNETKQAEKIALNAFMISPQSGFLKPRLENNLILFDVYKSLGQDKVASNYASKGLELKDSFLNSEMMNAISKMEVQYKTEQKEKELFLSRELQKVQSYKINAQKNFIMLLVGFLTLLSILLFLVYRLSRLRNQAKQKVEILLAELNHRVKNNLQIISGMLQMQMYMTKDEDQAAIIQTCINRVESINIIHALLYKEGFNGAINMKNFIDALTANLNNVFAEKYCMFEVSINIQNLRFDIGRAITIGLIINELITNIYKYAKAGKEKPSLEIRLVEEKNNCRLRIIDNCEFWDIQEIRKKNYGVGLSLVETLVKQLTGKWSVINNEQGTEHLIEFSMLN